MFVLVSLLCIGSLIHGGLISGLKEDASMTFAMSCSDKEKQALLGIKANLVTMCHNLDDWEYKENIDCCQWVGVRCNNRTGHVTEVDLSSYSDSLSATQRLYPHTISYDALTGILNPCVRPLRTYYDYFHRNEEAIFLDNALISWKGKQREFGRGLYLLKSIDISNNKLYGKLPYEITNLRGLVSLNFSFNKLHGEIPKHMGRLTSLDSLDLSRNEFSGNIPSSLSQITRLSYLDLSYNNLSGRIPLGPQLQLFNSSFYTGNPQLCGLPLTQRCGHPPPPPPPTVVGKEDVEEDRDEFWISYYTGMGAGFVVGFLGICGALYLNRACRYFIFASLNSVNDWIYVTVVVHFRRLHRKFRWV